VITHGNGPVVGKILLRQYYARETAKLCLARPARAR
jgi:carbamate kinase